MSIKQCGSASGCLTVPQNCGSDTEEECDIALSYKSVTGGVRFRLTSRQPDASYVALGISTDQMMVRERKGLMLRRHTDCQMALDYQSTINLLKNDFFRY